MAGFYNLDHKEVIRVKVKKCDGKMQPEYKKFSIDPQITSFEMLQGILARAFEIRSDFTISYLAVDTEGQSVYLSMLSDWDMDAAFQCAADPCLKLKVDLRPFEEEMEDWDVIAPAEIPQHKISTLLDKNSFLFSITGSISQNIGRTVHSMQKAMGLKQSDSEAYKPLKAPMSDMEFHNYLDSAGFMVKPNEFRLSIYQGGIEPSLRRVAWRHLLNIYPANMSGRDRFDYMKRKEEEYRKLREEWCEKFRNNTATEEVKYVAAMVKKDVLRTDRTHGFYAGTDDNENTLSLFHILVTYALTHPDVSYCQGMSDLASPILVTQKDEGQAYLCFCALMRRLRENFSLEGSAIMAKFSHFSMLLAMFDPGLYAYLQEQSAGDMFFCYRWFLLELKREFPFSDALYFLEVMWATLPPDPPARELLLVDPDYSSRLLSSSPCSPTFTFQHAMYAKLLAMRRVGALSQMRATRPSTVNTNCLEPRDSERTASFLNGNPTSNVSSFNSSPVGDLDDQSSEYPEVENSLTRSVRRRSSCIDEKVLENHKLNQPGSKGENLKDVNTTKNTPFDERSVREGDKKKPEASEDHNLNNSHDRDEEVEVTEDNGIVASQSSSSYSPSDCSQTVYKSQSPVSLGQQNELVTDAGDSRLLAEEDKANFMLSISSGEMDCGDSGITSELSQSSEQQTQFNLSLDCNSTTVKSEDSNSGESSETIDGRCKPNASPEHCSAQPSKMVENSADPNGGIFKSMKRLLSSPKKKNETPMQDGKKSPNVSPRHSTSHFVSNTEKCSAHGSERTVEDQAVPNALSDSLLSEGCQPASELTDNSTGTEEASGGHTKTTHPPRDPSKLPPPQEFGCGNPFLMFASLTMLLQHRDTILGGSLCYEEIAMHFDRLVRRHNAAKVLHHARQMYTSYLRAQQANIDRAKEEELGSSC